MLKLVLASKNLGKIAEFERMLGQQASLVKVLGLNDFPDMPDVEESGKTLSENARLKAQAIAKFTNLPALADDSGLFIDALNGDPGVLSARWAGYQGVSSQERDHANIERVLAQLKGVPKPERGAQFKSVVAFCDPRGQLQMIEKEELGGFKWPQRRRQQRSLLQKRVRQSAALRKLLSAQLLSEVQRRVLRKKVSQQPGTQFHQFQ